ncbi:hypothetical protein AB0L53_40260 [Nonomuraea sp. NPDC052129]|uniref:hypothetical protein n=1 Tax=Nonomuraea sp. NPDC052129 TaxID=3154651 RepID=UPI00341D0E43
MNHIVLGYDGSDFSVQALDEAELRKIPLTVAHAWQWPYGEGQLLAPARPGPIVVADKEPTASVLEFAVGEADMRRLALVTTAEPQTWQESHPNAARRVQEAHETPTLVVAGRKRADHLAGLAVTADTLAGESHPTTLTMRPAVTVGDDWSLVGTRIMPSTCDFTPNPRGGQVVRDVEIGAEKNHAGSSRSLEQAR